MNATHYPESSGFWPAYLKQHCSHACFLVSKKILLLSWAVSYSRLNLATLIITLEEFIIHIYNVYFLLLRTKQSVDTNSLIYLLLQLLEKSEEHILVDDFNVYHLI